MDISMDMSTDISMCGYYNWAMLCIYAWICDIGIWLVISLIRFSDINYCGCVGDADALLLLRILYSFFFLFF